MARTPVKNTTMKPTKAKKSTAMAMTKAGAKFAAKRVLPVYSAYEFGRAVKEKRYGDAASSAAWLTIPTGIASEAISAAASTKPYQNAQMRALDWVDSVSPVNKLRSAAAKSAATKGAAAAKKRREVAAKAKTKGAK